VVRFTSSMSSRLARSAGLISLAVLASRLLGVVRESVLASYFGASMQMDAYNVAFRIPNLLRDLFAEGAMTSAFVPAFTRTLSKRGREQAWRLGNLVINALLVVTGGLVVLGIVFAEPITRLIVAPAFVAVPGKLDLTVGLTRVMLPFLTTVAIAVAAMGMLNSLQRFFVPALSPAMFNIASILCAVLLAPLMPFAGWPPITAVAIGALIGGVGQVALQWPPLRQAGFAYRPVVDLKDPGLRRILVLMGPGTLGLAATQVNVFVNTILATTQGTGAVSWLGYAFRIMYLPIGLFGISIATAVLPSASRSAALDDTPAVRATVSRGLILMLLLNVPATFGLIALAVPIVRLLLERGQFLPADTAATAAALQFYAIGLVGYSAARIASPVFYAIGENRTPVVVSVCAILMNVAANLVLVQVAGFRGLALGTSAAAIANGAVLLYLLHRRLGGLDAALAPAIVKIVLASTVMAAVAVLSERAAWRVLPDPGLFAQSIRLLSAIGAALIALAATAKLLRIREFDDAAAPLLRRVQKLLLR
jgi:putative peptidoglycan lipid II flippase